MVTQAAVAEFEGAHTCWCCGNSRTLGQVVNLGNHPEVELCLPCAHFLHRQANAREDAIRPSPTARARDRTRTARNGVAQRQ